MRIQVSGLLFCSSAPLLFVPRTGRSLADIASSPCAAVTSTYLALQGWTGMPANRTSRMHTLIPSLAYNHRSQCLDPCCVFGMLKKIYWCRLLGSRMQDANESTELR